MPASQRDMPRFRPPEHIRRRADFERAYESGSRLTGRLMTVFVKANEGAHARLGIAATRKIGGAVVRNRAKRLARELFRHLKPASNLDIIVVPRREFANARYRDLECELSELLDRALRAPAGRRTGRPGRARRHSKL
jgi:ribonuclease P protein component